MRLPTYAELRRFVEVEGWDNLDGARPGRVGDHFRYTFTTPSGDRLYTRVSHGRGQIQDRDLFAHILRTQLKVSAEVFWEAVDRGISPRRPRTGSRETDEPALDAKLARNLITKVGLATEQLVGMTQDEAVHLWNEWLTKGASF